MKPKNNALFQLFVNEKPREPADDGYVGNLNVNDKILLLAFAPENSAIYGFNAIGDADPSSRKKYIIPKADKSAAYGLKCKIYEQRITIVRNSDGVCHTISGQNEIRLLELSEEIGRFRIWELALVSQNGKFFLTEQMVYEACCYRGGRDGDKLVCPYFQNKNQNWPELVLWLQDLFIDYFEGLPHIGEKKPEPPREPEAFPPQIAKVVWWNMREGRGMFAVGANISPNGVAVAHWQNSSPRTKNGFVYFKTGELVSFEASRKPPYVTKARDTKFVCELLGVKIQQNPKNKEAERCASSSS